MSLITAKASMRELAAKAQKIVSSEELSSADKRTALDGIDVDLKKAKEEIDLHTRVGEILGAETVDGEGGFKAYPHERPKQFKTFAQRVTESDQYRGVQTFAKSGGRFAESISFDSPGDAFGTDVKAANTVDEGAMATYNGAGGMGGQLVAPMFLPGILPLKFQALTIEDLIPTGTSDSPSVTYVIEAAFNDNTAAVAEKGLKPQLDLTLARRQDNAAKIANIAKVTDELIQDAPQFQAYLTQRMTFGVRREVEKELLGGTGAGATMTGLLNRLGLAPTITTTASLTAVKAMEGIFNQITALRSVSFVEPDAFVMNPLDWQTIRLGKDGNGQYYAGGPFAYGPYGGASPSNLIELWGLRGVVTSAIPQGTVLVGGFQECAQQFIRSGITVEMTNSNEDDFKNNLIALRCETRRILAVYRPAGFGKVALTA